MEDIIMRRKIFQGLMALVIFSAIVLMNTVVIVNDTGFVYNQFEELEINESQFNAYEADGEIRDYLAGEQKNLTLELLSQDEKKHLEDVKKLFTLGKILLGLFAFVIVVGLFEFKLDEISNIGMFLGGYIALFSGVAFIAFNNFDSAFDLFHRLLFTNDLWMMSAEDKLIMLYPNKFFIEAGWAVAKRSVVMAFICVLIFNIGHLKRGVGKVKGYFGW